MALQLNNVVVQEREHPRLRTGHKVVEPGTFLVLLGHNGAGKSTLLDVMSGLLKPNVGTVLGKDNLSYLFQAAEESLFAGTIVEEFAITWDTSAKSARLRWTEALQYLEKVQLTHLSPDTMAPTLSNGNQRRLAFALALARRPQMLLLDEPSVAVDTERVQLLQTQLRAFHEAGGTVVVATHDIDTFFPLATRVWVMEAGSIVYDGTPDALYSEPSQFDAHGIGLPASLRVLTKLQAAGVFTENMSKYRQLSPTEVGRLIAEKTMHCPPQPQSCVVESGGMIEPTAELDTMDEPSRRRPQSLSDARSRWIATTLITACLIGIQHAPGALLGVLLTMVLLLGVRVPFRNIMRWTIPWFFFAMFTGLVSGVQLGRPFHVAPYSFDMLSAWRTIVTVMPYWCFLQLGQVLIIQSSGLEVQAMVDWLARRIFLPLSIRRSAALTAGLVFRFIPTIGNLYKMQIKAFRARTVSSKRKQHLDWVRIGQVLAPFIIRLLHYGETVVDALTARNIIHSDMPYDLFLARKWRTHDWLLIGYGILSAASLILIRQIV